MGLLGYHVRRLGERDAGHLHACGGLQIQRRSASCGGAPLGPTRPRPAF
jgi:hypothetical protein